MTNVSLFCPGLICPQRLRCDKTGYRTTMRPTLNLFAKASRLPLNSKKANKDFYKGTGTGNIMRRKRLAVAIRTTGEQLYDEFDRPRTWNLTTHRLDEARIPSYIVPPGMADSRVSLLLVVFPPHLLPGYDAASTARILGRKGRPRKRERQAAARVPHGPQDESKSRHGWRILRASERGHHRTKRSPRCEREGSQSCKDTQVEIVRIAYTTPSRASSGF